MQWKDETSYSQNEKRNETEPRVWEVRFDDMRVVVHRIHRLKGWFVSCRQIGINDWELQVPSDKPEDAKRAGATMIAAELEDRIKQYGEVVLTLTGSAL